MGRLLFLHEDKGLPDGLDADWFFPQIRKRRDAFSSYKTRIDWLETYKTICPHLVYINDDSLDIKLKIAIRTFIENQCNGLCIMAKKDLSFRYRRPEAMGYDSDWWHRNRTYTIFHFEDAASAVLFRLSFEKETEEFSQFGEEEEYFKTMIVRWEKPNEGELIPLDEDF